MNTWDRVVVASAYLFMVFVVALTLNNIGELVAEHQAADCSVATITYELRQAAPDATHDELTAIRAAVDARCG